MTNTATENKNTHSYSIVPVENPGTKITHVEFNGKNYDDWSRCFRLALLAKGKLDYIDGTISKPADNDPDFKAWRSANALVSAWIFNTIEADLRTSITLQDDANLLWTDIKQRFTVVNDAYIFQLENDINSCKQGPTETVMSYYGRIKKLWDDVIANEGFPTCACKPCACNMLTLLGRQREKKRVRSFLMGLDSRFATLRSHILGTEPLPNLNQIYSRLLQEEGMRSSLLASTPESNSDPMSFVARFHSTSNNNQNTQNPPVEPPKKCIACKRSGHAFTTCFRVTGKFPDW
ncbi:uncharacterized protein LOC141588202 [Silene latifolia]|uniref:uncharacterized protein LOC141588202 n=1 Tax=Silene latifolia TaxID=37657 RepID=UPI003D773861